MLWFCSLFSKKNLNKACNKYCKICRKTGIKPNKLGHFLFEQNKIVCTGCRNSFTVAEFSKVHITNIKYDNVVYV